MGNILFQKCSFSMMWKEIEHERNEIGKRGTFPSLKYLQNAFATHGSTYFCFSGFQKKGFQFFHFQIPQLDYVPAGRPFGQHKVMQCFSEGVSCQQRFPAVGPCLSHSSWSPLNKQMLGFDKVLKGFQPTIKRTTVSILFISRFLSYIMSPQAGPSDNTR